MNLNDLIPNYNLLTIRPVGDGTVKLFLKLIFHCYLKGQLKLGCIEQK